MTDLYFAMKITEGMDFQDFLIFITMFIGMTVSFCVVMNYLNKWRNKK